jgi:hypothetical protein
VQTTSELLSEALWGLGGVLTFLFVFLISNKAIRELRERRAAALRRELEPKILAYLNGRGDQLRPIPGPLGRFERSVVEEILLDNARFLKGAARSASPPPAGAGFLQGRASPAAPPAVVEAGRAARLAAMKSTKAAPG